MMKKKIFSMLLSLAISFGLWLYVVTVISPEWEATYYNVPVELTGVEHLNAQNLLIVSDPSLSMDLTLRGSRTDLNKLSNANITILADASKISTAGEHKLKLTFSYPGSIQSGMVEVMSSDPQEITVTVAEQLSKTISVEVYYTGSVPAGYEVDKTNISMDHTTVTVRGPRDVVEQIDHAGIIVDVGGKMSTFVWDYPLILYSADEKPIVGSRHLTSNVEEVRTIVQINRVKKVPLTYEIDATNSGLLPEMVTVYPSVQEVTVMGSETVLEQLTELNLGTISLINLTESTVLSYRLSLPNGVVCKENVDTVFVEVNIPEMASKAFHVSAFDVRNVPENLGVEILGSPVVEIRGPKEILEQLVDEDILGIIDCSGINLNATFAPISYMVQGYEYLRIHADLSVCTIRVTSG